jgi:hypothetical protein
VFEVAALVCLGVASSVEILRPSDSCAARLSQQGIMQRRSLPCRAHAECGIMVLRTGVSIGLSVFPRLTALAVRHG